MKKNKILFAAVLAFLTGNSTLDAQPCGPMNPSPDNCQNCVDINLPTPVQICSGTSYAFVPSLTLPPGFDIKAYSWSGTTVTPASGSGILPLTIITPPALGSPACSVVSYPYTLSVNALAPNVVLNPDFSSGPPYDFCTQYINTPPPGLGSTNYTVCPNANLIPGWGVTNFFDHTSGTPAGSMLICQGDPNVNVIWQQEVPVCLGASYDFSYWQASLHTSSGFPTTHAELWVHIIDGAGGLTTWGPFANTGPFDAWQLKNINWTNPVGGPIYTTATIMITGSSSPGPTPSSTMPFGTVFALDDISLRRQCKATADMNIEVEYSDITGPSKVCVGSTISLSGCLTGGSWSISGGGAATIDASGNVTGITAGTETVTYTSPSGCTATKTITINALPVIVGPTSVCTDATISWTTTPAVSGFWGATSHLVNTSTPMPSTSVTLKGVLAGTGTIYFTDPSTGCSTSANVTVNQTPAPIPNSYVCAGYAGLTLAGTPPGGTWTCAPPSVATINATSGAVNPISPGTAIITYTTPAGCSTSTAVFVYNCANGSGVVGYNLCQGQSATFILALGIPPGGTWTSSNTAVATVNSITGVVTGVSGGTVTITYTVPGTGSWSTTITVFPPATASVTTITTATGYSFVFTTSCPGGTIIYVVKDFFGNTLGSSLITTAGTIPYDSIKAWRGATAFTVCIQTVVCNGCFWGVDSCASVNPPLKPSIVNDADRENQLSIIPNPNKGNFYISGTLFNEDKSTEVKLEVIDMFGKVVFTEFAVVENGAISKNISLDNIPNSIYSIRISGNNETRSLKFVVDR